MSSQEELEAIASRVISILKTINEYKDARVVIIGGLAVWKYPPDGRTTKDVDFMVNISNAPRGVKDKLLALPDSPFIQQAQLFYYKSTGGSLIQIDITPEGLSPYMPAAAIKLRDLQPGIVPYISATDLVVFKVYSCGLRAERTKRRTDASDAENLLEQLASRGPLSLTNDQKTAVEKGIDDVVAYGGKAKKWWKEMLGLSA
ncbi:hypothetical protein DV735_g5480, partial [Chaetothyriales sp. CBS 134920]